MARQDVTIRRAGTYQLVFSTSADRSNPVALDGATVSGVIYVFVTPTASVNSAVFYKGFGGGVFREDSAAPFDFVGEDASGDALAVQVSDHWADGPASIHAVLACVDGTFTVSAYFTASTTVSPPDAVNPAEPGPINATTSLPAPTIVITGGSTPTPSTVSVTTSVGGAASTGTSTLDAVGYFAGNNATPSPGGSGARESIEHFETTVGRRVKFAASNFGVTCTTASLGTCATSGAADTVTKTGHGLTVADTVHMTSPSTAGITTNTAYWVVNPSANTFQLASSKNGTPINITADANVTFVKHVFLGGASALVGPGTATYRTEWATRPDVTQCVIFHYYQVAGVSGQTQSPPPAFRRSRRSEIINGTWDAVYNAFFNRLYRTNTGCTFDASTGWITDTGHDRIVGEEVKITAKTGASAFTLNTSYYVLESEPANNRYKLTATGPWAWTGSETAVTGGTNGTAMTTVWRFNIVFRVSHEGDIAYPGGYPDGRLWDGVTAQDEIDCRQSWEKVCDLIHSHGFKAIWAGDGNMFLKIKNTGNMGSYAASFAGDERECWEYGLPGATVTNYVSDLSGVKATYDGSGTHTGGYLDGIDLDVYYGTWKGKTGAECIRLIRDELRPAAEAIGVPWSIAELGIWFVQPGVTGVSASASTNLFTKSSGHGFADNQRVVIGFSGTAPTPILKNTNTIYYVEYVTSTTFGLRSSSGGARIDLTSDGSDLSVHRWVGITDTGAAGAGDMSASTFVNQVWDQVDASPAYPAAGSCHYVCWFRVGSSVPNCNPTHLERYAPDTFAQVYGTRLGS